MVWKAFIQVSSKNIDSAGVKGSMSTSTFMMSVVLAYIVTRCSPLSVSSSLGSLSFFPLEDFGRLATPQVCVLDSETGTARTCSQSSLEELEEDDAVTATAENRKRKEMTVREEERISVDVMQCVGLGKSRMRLFG
jgi:hypothetical protein